ncbi:MAG TPA: condensation domain-containing protein, partial [Ktedonobacteraceae bacterium]
MSDTSARIKKLTPEQKALLFQRLQRARPVQKERISPYPRKGGALPLSFAQQRLWLHGQLDPTGYLYVVPLALRLKGSLQVDALETSLQEIMRRHETLRTTFEMRDGELCLVISQTPAFSLKLIELPLSPLEEGEEQLLTMLCAEARQPFDLVRGPLLRATLFRLASQDHVLLLALHHIVCDGWSRSVLFQELTVLYETFLRNKL